MYEENPAPPVYQPERETVDAYGYVPAGQPSKGVRKQYFSPCTNEEGNFYHVDTLDEPGFNIVQVE